MDGLNAMLGQAGAAAAVGVGMVFALAGFDKLRHRALVPGVIANYRLLPAALVMPVALVLPPVESALGLGLIASGLGAGAALGWLALPATALLLGFAAAMAVNIARGRSHIDCGCGHAALRQPLSAALVVRNAVLALILVPHMLAPAGSALLAAVAGLALFLLVQVFNAITALAASPLAAAHRGARH